MKARILIIALVLLATAASIVAADDDGPAINYISSDAVYVNVGSRAGLQAGARVTVIRDGVTIAVLEVTYVSSHSASCRIVSRKEEPRVGDSVFFEAAPAPEVAPPPVRTETVSQPARSRSRPLRGSVTLESLWQRDLDGSDLSSVQPGVSMRLNIPRPMGSAGTLRIRHRSRLYHRSRPLNTEGDTDEWTHRLSEFGWYFDGDGIRDAVGFGRVLNPFIRGLGTMDGGYATLAVGEHYRVGVAGGLDPRLEDSSMQPDRQKVGVFVAYEAGTPATRRIATTFALSGSYDTGTINREFGYVQTTLSLDRRLSLYHSVEIDVNRGWRRDAEGNPLSFSNTYASAHATVTEYLAFDASYDARRNIRDYRVHDSPDSLFDDALSTGYGAGLTLRLPRHVRFNARAGIRSREGQETDNRHGSLSLVAGQFPVRGHSVSARLSVSDTPYITGYRPAVTYRFAATRRTQVTLGGGAYIYDQKLDRLSSGFGEVGLHHTFGRYFAAGHVRRISGDALDSMSFLAEVGMSL